MTDPLHVPPGEQETVRVFAIDLPPEEAAALTHGGAGEGGGVSLRALLGVKDLDRTYVEAFPAADLKGVGLSGYVAEGLGVADADVAADAPALDAVTGYVAVVHSGAFGGKEAQLAPRPPLRHLGTYRMAAAEPVGLTPPGRRGETPAEVPPDPRPGPPARVPRALVLVMLLAAAVVVLAVAFLIGARGE